MSSGGAFHQFFIRLLNRVPINNSLSKTCESYALGYETVYCQNIAVRNSRILFAPFHTIFFLGCVRNNSRWKVRKCRSKSTKRSDWGYNTVSRVRNWHPFRRDNMCPKVIHCMYARNRLLLKKNHTVGCGTTECSFLKFLISILLFQFHQGRRCRGYWIEYQ